MNGSTTRDSRSSVRAFAERASKARDIQTGAAKEHAISARARKQSAVPPPSSSIVTRSSAYIEPEAREAMIAEAAYFRCAHRGFEPGHEVDDWLAAESDIDAALSRGDLSVCGSAIP